ncbi:hypothetical protein [Archangium sp.]|uniref:hypothetical protein n=1 Tax=Archangium sp. TaxID=1872627 RepID=UPI003899B453
MMRSLLLALLVLVGLPGLASAQTVTPYTPRIAGQPMTCMSPEGVPVAFVPNTSLADVGLWFPAWPNVPAHVEYNPRLLVQLPPEAQLFWFWHTCAHGVGNASSEEGADCGAIGSMMRLGLVTGDQVLALQSWFVNEPVRVPWGHRPGLARVRLLPGCYSQAGGAVGVSGSNGQTLLTGQTRLPSAPSEEYPGVKRWRFCSHIPGVSAPTSSGHVTQGSCDRERSRLQREDANYVVTDCVLTAVERCTARER